VVTKTGNRPRVGAGALLTRSAQLTADFYDRDPGRVARSLLGKVLIRKHGRQILAGRIVETEAYLGTNDFASHSATGKSARNAVLFGPPGHAYVYFIYGNHYCLNVSCLPDGVAGGVLFRAFEPLIGIPQMAAAREMELSPDDLKNVALLRKISSGPGRMCEALSVTRVRDNDKKFFDGRSDLQILDDGFKVGRVLVTKRIGITKSADHPLRFVIALNPFVSGPRPKSGSLNAPGS
jgi:DNA-3-methyladenine glycosylase